MECRATVASVPWSTAVGTLAGDGPAQAVGLFVLQSEPKNASRAGARQIQTILDDVLRQVHPVDPSSPRRAAGLLRESLAASPKIALIAPLMFAGVVTTDDGVAVCTAGDVRVHVTAGREIIFVTRDHNILADGDPSELSHIPRSALATIPTRDLLGTRDPESWVVDVERPFRILVCDASVHRYRDPAEYALDLSSDREGLVAVIDCTA